MQKLTEEIDARLLDFIRDHRVAHLATANAKGMPHVVPICYAFDGKRVFMALDRKPKRAKLKSLRRVKNILENPNVCLVIDDYNEDWQRLGFVMINGKARLLEDGPRQAKAVEMLNRKYPQYAAMGIEGCPVVEILVDKVVAWSGARKGDNGE